MQKLLLIYNPHAGRQKIVHQLHEIVYLFTTAGYQVTVHPTLFHGDAVKVACEQGQDFDLIVCCGGDGTLNEVVTGLRMLPKIFTLGYLPAGTTNDFSKTLKLPVDLMEAAQIAVSGRPAPCDVGDFNGKPFIYVAAFGVFSELSYATPQNAKNALGHLAYVLGGIKSISQLKPVHMRVTHDGEAIEGDFIYGMVADSVSVGGFRGIAESAVVLDDGLFEVMLVRNPQSAEEFASIINALHSQMPDGNVIGFQSGDITFECDDSVAWTLDGEFGGDTACAHVTNISRAVNIMRG